MGINGTVIIHFIIGFPITSQLLEIAHVWKPPYVNVIAYTHQLNIEHTPGLPFMSMNSELAIQA